MVETLDPEAIDGPLESSIDHDIKIRGFAEWTVGARPPRGVDAFPAIMITTARDNVRINCHYL